MIRDGLGIGELAESFAVSGVAVRGDGVIALFDATVPAEAKAVACLDTGENGSAGRVAIGARWIVVPVRRILGPGHVLVFDAIECPELPATFYGITVEPRPVGPADPSKPSGARLAVYRDGVIEWDWRATAGTRCVLAPRGGLRPGETGHRPSPGSGVSRSPPTGLGSRTRRDAGGHGTGSATH